MRPGVLLRRTARLKKRYAGILQTSPLSNAQTTGRLKSVFGQYVQGLPPSLRAELLRPHLQRWPHRRDLFTTLGEKGEMVLELLLNDHLGTKNVALSPRVLEQFCKLHNLDAVVLEHTKPTSAEDSVNLLLECVGAVDSFVGPTQCREMVREKILDGPMGVSSLYLEALSNNEL